MSVTNIWHVLNLRSTPFFQDALEPDQNAEHPLSLFVGRARESREVLTEIGGATNSRTAIQGPPGVGKTTLVNYIKAEASRSGYLVDASPISVASATTASDLRLAILGSVHDALAARDSTFANKTPMRDVRQLIDTERTRSWSVSSAVAALGGLGAASAAQRHTGPGALTVKPERLLRQLSEMATDELQAPGIIIHLNNLENASEAAQDTAARLVRDLRDTGLTYEGFHYLLAGTDDAIRTLVTAQEQLRSVFFNPGSLSPLGEAEVDAMLEERYEHLRLFDNRPWLTPVEPAAVRHLYRLFMGNLRGTLHALNAAAKHLIGHGDNPTDPMTMERMVPILRVVYAQKLTADLNSTEINYLRQMANRHGIEPTLTQKDAQSLLELRPPAASELFTSLRSKGYLAKAEAEVTGKPGRQAQRYRLVGPAVIALGLAPSQ